MKMADLVAFAVVLVLAVGWFWFRAKTDRGVRTACLMLGGFQIVAGVAELVLSDVYGDFAGWVVLALGLTMVLFRQGWTLALTAGVLVVTGAVSAVAAFTEPHYANLLWGAVQLVIAVMLFSFLNKAKHRAPRRAPAVGHGGVNHGGVNHGDFDSYRDFDYVGPTRGDIPGMVAELKRDMLKNHPLR